MGPGPQHRGYSHEWMTGFAFGMRSVSGTARRAMYRDGIKRPGEGDSWLGRFAVEAACAKP